MTELKDWMNSINLTKNNLIDEDESIEREYPPFIINKCFSSYVDCLMYANEMNMHGHLDKKMQYDFYINTIRKRKRFSPWIRKDQIEDFEYIKKYFGYSDEKAQESLKILTKEQIKYIKSEYYQGGLK